MAHVTIAPLPSQESKTSASPRGWAGWPTGTIPRGSSQSRVASWLPWSCAALLAAWCYVIMIVAARIDLLGRFDDGIEYSTVTYLLHGQLPYSDFYQPYGIGLGFPGVLPHLFGVDGVFALRLVYGVFPALVTLLAVPLVWRRCGPPLALLVGVLTLVSTTPRYSMGFAALFGFALIVDRAVRRSSTGTLRDAAAEHPRELLAASAVCSLAGWARTEYAVFALLWALVLVIALPRGRRWRLPALTVLLAALPTLIVFVTGGLRHLWWFVSYTLSSSPSGFHAQRGHPIEWHLLSDWLSRVAQLRFGPSEPGKIVATYGVALVVVLAGLAIALVPAWRRRVLASDRSLLTPFMVVVCAIVLYGQAARFSEQYGAIGTPVFWVAGAMLVGRRAPRGWVTIAGLLVLIGVAYPWLPSVAPGTVYDTWAERPSTSNRVVVPGFNRIPIAEDGGPPSMAALIAQWHALGLDGRSTFSVGLRNDVAWANDAIVGYLLDAPAAAWPLTFDPGLFNSTTVERATVAELCRDRAPVVQATAYYAYPPGVKPYVGSRLLDEFLAADYEVRAVAGFYRILLPATPRCVLPRQLSEQALQSGAERWLSRGELAAAGAMAGQRLERARKQHREGSTVDASLLALGGYTLKAQELPGGALGRALSTLVPGAPSAPGLAAEAARAWPSDLERLAVQTAWIDHRTAGEAGTAPAAAAVAALAKRHANWPQAIANLAAIQPPSAQLLAVLARSGAHGMPVFDRWRRDYFAQSGEAGASIAAGVALIEDYVRSDDPVEAGQAELQLAALPGVTPGCALALRISAGHRPGVRSPVVPGKAACTQPELLDLAR